MAEKRRHSHHSRSRPHQTRGSDSGDDDLVAPRKVTGKELSETEELSARITTLVEMLDEKGIVNKSEYNRMVAMRLHEISKASAFEELDEEL